MRQGNYINDAKGMSGLLSVSQDLTVLTRIAVNVHQDFLSTEVLKAVGGEGNRCCSEVIPYGFSAVPESWLRHPIHFSGLHLYT